MPHMRTRALLMASIAACGEAPPPSTPEEPVVEQCHVPTTVCAVTIDSCANPALAEDCTQPLDPTAATRMVVGNVRGLADPGDPEGWLDVSFSTTGAGNSGEAGMTNGATYEDTGQPSEAIVYVIDAGGRWVWSAHGRAIEGATLELEIQVDTGCGFTRVGECVAPPDADRAAVTVSTGAVSLGVGARLRTRGRRSPGTLDYLNLVSMWIEGRRFD